MSYFKLWETNAEGEPKRAACYIETGDIQTRLLLIFGRQTSYAQVRRWIDLAKSAPAHQIDCCTFDENTGVLLRSYRMQYYD